MVVALKMAAGKRRVVIENVWPEVDCGRFAAKRAVGEDVVVEADIFADGHDELAAVLRWRAPDADWTETPMELVENDRWRGRFRPEAAGTHHFTIRGWVDAFATWRRDTRKKVDAGQDVAVEMLIGSDLVARAARRAKGDDARALREWAARLKEEGAVDDALGDELAALVHRYPDRAEAVAYDREVAVVVDRERARFSAWYEMFPRSTSPEPGRHGTLADTAARLDYVAGMGFDVVYLPPIHPIGRTFRKGPNNNPDSSPGDPGSPWAIGSEEGGHTAIHPDLGTMEDFERLVARARELDMEIALDLAFQCSPDHPWVHKHPEWFRNRPDGTIQYAENPPKRYQDIYPIDFDTPAWRELWDELKGVVEFWIDHGVRVFRVDNPHTKPFRFWEWLIANVRASHPDVIFLSEAFTRPKVMYRLAKLGFTQSYTYYAWRNEKWELTEYFTELTRPPVSDFFRPNVWPNTPDILTEALQTGGRPAFMARFALAATLSASYGIYGPAFELGEHVPVAEGSEEYLHSEKYEVRTWDLDAPHSLAGYIGAINRIRRENPALHRDTGLRFHPTDNDRLIAYSKATDDRSNVILAIVNLDPVDMQAGWTDLALDELGVRGDWRFTVEDLLTGETYQWRGPRNFIQLDPASLPAHVFRVSEA